MQPPAIASFSDSDESLRADVREFLDSALASYPVEYRARSWMQFDADFSRSLAQRGWVGVSVPREYGGGGRSMAARFILAEELLAAGAPVGAHWVADRQSAPVILRYGTAPQKAFYLPRICRAEAFFCIGMSEPGAGSDLASVRTRARPAGQGWVLNGGKIWTTYAHHAHYMIALVRTSGGPEDRQAGLSQMLIDLKRPGVSIRPIRDLAGDSHFAEVFFEDVELPAESLLGREGAGWEQVNAELAFERSGPERIHSSMVLAQCWLDFCRTRPGDADLQESVGRIAAWLAVARALCMSVAARLERGENPMLEASRVKDLGTQIEQQIPQWIAACLGRRPDIAAPPQLWRVLAYTEQIAPSFSLRGGTREVLRGIIARGLGLR